MLTVVFVIGYGHDGNIHYIPCLINVNKLVNFMLSIGKITPKHVVDKLYKCEQIKIYIKFIT